MLPGRSLVCYLWVTLLLLSSSIFTGASADTLRVIRVNCGALLPLDSLRYFETEAALERALSDYQTDSVTGSQVLRIGSLDISDAGTLQAIERLSGSQASRVTLLSLDATSNAYTSSCVFGWMPGRAYGVDVRNAVGAVALLRLPNDNAGSGCVLNTTVRGTARSSSTAQSSGSWSRSYPLSVPSSSSSDSAGATQAVFSIPSSSSTHLVGISVTLTLGCQVYAILSANTEGPIDEWYAWIPATVYTAIVLPIVLLAVFFSRRMSLSSTALLNGLVFVGYVGSTIGLMIELFAWQVGIGRYFPFPSSVTLYVCLVVGYVLTFPVLAFSHYARELVLSAVARALLYGLLVAHVVVYWTASYYILASVGLGLLFLTNVGLVWVYSRFIALLSRSDALKRELRHIPFVWLAPATPFMPPVLLYIDIFFTRPQYDFSVTDAADVSNLAAGGGGSRSPSPEGVVSYAHAASNANIPNPKLMEAVRLFHIQTSLPFILLVDFGSLALLIVATTFHPTFLVALAIQVLFVTLHVSWTLRQYFTQRRRWRLEGTPITAMLWPAVLTLVEHHNLDQYHEQQKQERRRQVFLAMRGARRGGQDRRTQPQRQPVYAAAADGGAEPQMDPQYHPQPQQEEAAGAAAEYDSNDATSVWDTRSHSQRPPPHQQQPLYEEPQPSYPQQQQQQLQHQRPPPRRSGSVVSLPRSLPPAQPGGRIRPLQLQPLPSSDLQQQQQYGHPHHHHHHTVSNEVSQQLQYTD